jgi:hypothetical protein
MISKQELAEQYVRVSQAAVSLRVDSSAVYRLLQRGALDGVCLDGRWMVEASSVERLRKARAKEAARAMFSVGAVA